MNSPILNSSLSKTALLVGMFLTLFLVFFSGNISISFAENNKKPEIIQEIKWNTGNIRLKHEYQHFILKNAGQYISIVSTAENPEISRFCFEDGREENMIQKKQVNTQSIEDYLAKKVSSQINQEVSHVKITKNPENSHIEFEGYGYTGIELDLKKSAELISYAIKTGATQVTLATKKTQPQVLVEDEELKKLGITEVVAVGRSDFYPSSRSRIQNIMAGADRFNGFLIKPGEEFSFNTQLGLVDGSTGYAQEYVILGPKVVKEYGGGLCQVSSTAYRGVMLAGLEITERHNHSFAVNHYLPYGSDATIYQGVKDFRFKNDSDTAILIQTRRGGHRNSELFFHYYGTKADRDIKIFGPAIKNRRKALPSKVTYSSTMAAGTSRKVSGAVRGLDASFGRIVKDKISGKKIHEDQHFSHYQSRGKWTIRGGAEPAPQGISSGEASRKPAFVDPI